MRKCTNRAPSARSTNCLFFIIVRFCWFVHRHEDGAFANVRVLFFRPLSFFPYAYLTVTSPVTPCPLFLVNPPPCPSFPRQLVPLSTRPSGAQVCPPATTPSPPCRRTFARRLALLCPVGLARATCGSGGGRGGGGAEFSGLCVSLTIIFSWVTNLFSYFAENIREYEETDC